MNQGVALEGAPKFDQWGKSSSKELIGNEEKDFASA